MAKTLNYGENPSAPVILDYPDALPKGSRVECVLHGFDRFRPFSNITTKSNNRKMNIVTFQARVIDHGSLNGFTIKVPVFLPEFDKFEKDKEEVRSKLYPFGVDTAYMPVPENEDEIVQMFNGKGPWAEFGEVWGRQLFVVTAGDPREFKTSKGIPGRETTVKSVTMVDPNVAELLKEFLEAYRTKRKNEEAKAAAEAKEEDDCPF